MKKFLLAFIVFLLTVFVFTGCKESIDITKKEYLDGTWIGKDPDGVCYLKIIIEDMNYNVYFSTNDYFSNAKAKCLADEVLPNVEWESESYMKGDIYLKGSKLYFTSDENSSVLVGYISKDKKSFSVQYYDNDSLVCERE